MINLPDFSEYNTRIRNDETYLHTLYETQDQNTQRNLIRETLEKLLRSAGIDTSTVSNQAMDLVINKIQAQLEKTNKGSKLHDGHLKHEPTRITLIEGIGEPDPEKENLSQITTAHKRALFDTVVGVYVGQKNQRVDLGIEIGIQKPIPTFAIEAAGIAGEAYNPRAIRAEIRATNAVTGRNAEIGLKEISSELIFEALEAVRQASKKTETHSKLAELHAKIVESEHFMAPKIGAAALESTIEYTEAAQICADVAEAFAKVANELNTPAVVSALQKFSRPTFETLIARPEVMLSTIFNIIANDPAMKKIIQLATEAEHQDALRQSTLERKVKEKAPTNLEAELASPIIIGERARSIIKRK